MVSPASEAPDLSFPPVMPRRLRPLMAAFCLIVAAATADAACFADYKAKRDGPLQLHYGVIRLAEGDCASVGNAGQIVARRIAADGWELLTVVSTFDDAGAEQRKSRAGDFFLRY